MLKIQDFQITDSPQNISTIPQFPHMILIDIFDAYGHQVEIFTCLETGTAVWRMGEDVAKFEYDSVQDARDAAMIIADLS